MSAEVAYDLDNFAAKTEEQHDEELKTRSLRVIKNRRKEKSVAPLRFILDAMVVIIVALVMIYSQVVLTELTAEVNSYDTKISALDTERMRLEGALEASTSIKTLGLSKIDSSQIEYVNLTGDDEISVAKTGGKYLIEQYWNDFIEFIAEYLHF